MPLGFSSLGRSLEEVPLPPVLAVLFGAVAAILVLATPDWMFDRMVLDSGFAMLAPSISPPFGEVPRIIAAMAAMWLVAGYWLVSVVSSSLSISNAASAVSNVTYGFSAFRRWPLAPSSCRALARHTTSPAGRWAMWPRQRR